LVHLGQQSYADVLMHSSQDEQLKPRLKTTRHGQSKFPLLLFGHPAIEGDEPKSYGLSLP
jgi:hypothetical protein